MNALQEEYLERDVMERGKLVATDCVVEIQILLVGINKRLTILVDVTPGLG